jgi:hypothetical protein
MRIGRTRLAFTHAGCTKGAATGCPDSTAPRGDPSRAPGAVRQSAGRHSSPRRRPRATTPSEQRRRHARVRIPSSKVTERRGLLSVPITCSGHALELATFRGDHQWGQGLRTPGRRPQAHRSHGSDQLMVGPARTLARRSRAWMLDGVTSSLACPSMSRDVFMPTACALAGREAMEWKDHLPAPPHPCSRYAGPRVGSGARPNGRGTAWELRLSGAILVATPSTRETSCTSAT